MKHFAKHNSSLCSLHGQIGIQMNIYTVNTSKRKIINFPLKKASATKHSPLSNVYYMEIYRNFLFEYSLMGILKPKFTRKNEIWCIILEKQVLSKKLRKTQERTSLTKFQFFLFEIKVKSKVNAKINMKIIHFIFNSFL